MILSTDLLQLTLTSKMSVTVNNNSPIQDYVHPDDHTQPTYNNINSLLKLYFEKANCFCLFIFMSLLLPLV